MPISKKPKASKGSTPSQSSDARYHVSSMLMRESLLDKGVMASTETPVVRMLPEAHVVKIGGRSIMDGGRETLGPLVEALATLLAKRRLIISTGGGLRSRHVYSIAMDLGLPTGVLAQLALADGLASAHILGTLLAPYGVVAVPPELFGHLLPLFMRAVPGVIYNGDPPYGLWEHPPRIGRIPPHRSDAGALLLCDCFGCQTLTLVKDVDGLYSADPKCDSQAEFIPAISVAELKRRSFKTLPFDRVMIDLLPNTRLTRRFQVINGRKPHLLERALRGEHVGTIVHA